MDMNSVHFGTQSQGKDIQRRRSWTCTEEKCLAESFQDLLAQNWKTENGFKNGFLGQLEQKMRIALPGTDIRGHPHINSKYNTWKTKFKEVFACLQNSGFAWDETTQTVHAPDSVWEELIKAHPSLKEVKDRKYPHYNVWYQMFAKDTAVGTISRDTQSHKRRAFSQPPSAVNLDEDDNSFATNHNSYSPENGSPSDAGTPKADSPKNGTPTTKNIKKRKKMEGIEELTLCIRESWSKATATIDKVAEKMGYELAEAEGRKNLSQVIGDLPLMINRDQKMKACLVIGHDKESLDMFYGFTIDEKCDLVKMAIEGNIKY